MLAICAAGLSGVMDCINPVNGVAMQMTVNRTVPNTLNIRWMMVVRLALRLVPMEAKTAVIQVPMFCPKRTYTALSRPITPLRASACRIPTEAEEDWIRAVKAAPARMPTTGLEKVLTRLTKAGHSAGLHGRAHHLHTDKEHAQAGQNISVVVNLGLLQKDHHGHAHKGEQGSHGAHVQGDELAGDGGADIGHDDPHRLFQRHHAGVDEAHHHDSGGGGG